MCDPVHHQLGKRLVQRAQRRVVRAVHRVVGLLPTRACSSARTTCVDCRGRSIMRSARAVVATKVCVRVFHPRDRPLITASSACARRR